MSTTVDQDAALASPGKKTPGRAAWASTSTCWIILLLVATVALLYSQIITGLVKQWWKDPDFSHGFFVPIFSGFVAWQKRRELMKLPVVPASLGLILIAASMLILIFGVLGAELFLSRSSLILLLGGLIIYFLGWSQFCLLFFPWALLFLMVPIPAIVLNQITLPLQFLASSFASSLLNLCGVPVLREGNVIHLPTMTLEVVEACSGIRSLISLITLAVIYGFLLEPSIVRRVLLVVGAIPIAVAANALRIMGTGLTGLYWNPDKAQGFFHEFSGWVIFVLSLGLLFALHGFIRLFGRRREMKTA